MFQVHFAKMHEKIDMAARKCMDLAVGYVQR